MRRVTFQYHRLWLLCSALPRPHRLAPLSPSPLSSIFSPLFLSCIGRVYSTTLTTYLCYVLFDPLSLSLSSPSLSLPSPFLSFLSFPSLSLSSSSPLSLPSSSPPLSLPSPVRLVMIYPTKICRKTVTTLPVVVWAGQ